MISAKHSRGFIEAFHNCKVYRGTSRYYFKNHILGVAKNVAQDRDSHWATVNLGSEEDRRRVDMESQLKEAKKWDTIKLSDNDASTFNRMLGVEAEVEELGMKNKKGGDVDLRRNASKKGERPDRGINLRPMEDTLEKARVKGFLDMNPYVCSGCGTPFQSSSPNNPGFLSKEKLQTHFIDAKFIREKQEAVKILQMAGLEVDSDAAEQILREANLSPDVIAGVRALGRAEDDNHSPGSSAGGISILRKPVSKTAVQEEPQKRSTKISDTSRERLLGADVDIDSLDIAGLNSGAPTEKSPDDQVNEADNAKEDDNGTAATFIAAPVCVCQRCFRLKQYGQVDENLRPGWSTHELLTPERFQQLLGAVRETNAVVLCLIDVFDLKGSLLSNLRHIAGSNPIVIAANKVDLLPRDVSENRIIDWIHAEVKEYCGLISPRDAKEAADEILRSDQRAGRFRSPQWRAAAAVVESNEGVLRRNNVHLVSCQSGKGMDQLLSFVMGLASSHGNKVYVMGAANVGKSSFINRMLTDTYTIPKHRKRRSTVPQATVSNLPGTTLDFLKISLPNGVTMIDTPGLLNKGQLTSKLTTEELRQVIPVKPINAVTLRLVEGKCVMIGGFATVELLEGRPFFFTFFISNEVKLHVTISARVPELLEKHVGTIISPPASPERVKELGPFVSQDFEVEGESWRKSGVDVVIAGLGWVSLTGPGVCKLRVTVPEGTEVGLRSALLPYEASHSTAKFTGGRLLKKSGKGPGTGSKLSGNGGRGRAARSAGKGYGWRA